MSSVVSNNTPNVPLVDKDGKATYALIRWMQAVGSTVNGAFDPAGNYQGPIGALATIVGRKTLATIVQHLTDLGVMKPAGLPAATTTEQGAVILPAGASSNTLGTAAIQPSSAFDPSGSAASAQAAAAADATTKANAAQANAQAFATTSIASAFAPGLSVTITTAALTVGGTQGNMVFTNGLLTAQAQAT